MTLTMTSFPQLTAGFPPAYNPAAGSVGAAMSAAAASLAQVAAVQSQLLSGGTTVPTSTHSSNCDGRPLVTDPQTGQSICSCQYPSLLYPRVPGLDYNPFAGIDPAVLCSSLGNPIAYEALARAKEAMANGGGESVPTPHWAPPGGYPYDTYPYPGYPGVDLANGNRRKNATRETTSTLKAWLYEHRKNPYPTKGEKIMLAIITKMTLTQVSTWFANARRRLKKENKMTWSPRNRCDDDRDDDKSIASDDDANMDDLDNMGDLASPAASSTQEKPACKQETVPASPPSAKSNPITVNEGKPKIWSLAETATSKSRPTADGTTANGGSQQAPLFPTVSEAAGTATAVLQHAPPIPHHHPGSAPPHPYLAPHGLPRWPFSSLPGMIHPSHPAAILHQLHQQQQMEHQQRLAQLSPIRIATTLPTSTTHMKPAETAVISKESGKEKTAAESGAEKSHSPISSRNSQNSGSPQAL